MGEAADGSPWSLARRVEPAGDLDDDGVEDVVVSDPGYGDWGGVSIFSGADLLDAP